VRVLRLAGGTVKPALLSLSAAMMALVPGSTPNVIGSDSTI
jgi:hypothetical protein